MNSLTQSKRQVGLIVALPLAAWTVASPARAGPESVTPETATETVVSETPGEAATETVAETDVAEVMEPGAVDIARLDAWLKYVADEDEAWQKVGGSFALVGSSAVLAFGIWAFVKSPPNTELNKGVGMLAVAVAGPGLAIGILELATHSASKKRWNRWQEAKAGGLTVDELRRFEGEFRAYSLEAKRERLRARWSSFGLGITGGLILGLTPAASLSSDAQAIGYLTGGIALGVGMAGFGFSFIRTSEEEYWRDYSQGLAPPKGNNWFAAPAVGRKFAGARVVGQF